MFRFLQPRISRQSNVSQKGSCQALPGFLLRQDRRAGYPGVVAQLGSDDLDAFHRARHRVFLGRFDDDTHHFISQRLHDSAAEHDDLGSKNINEVRHADADVFGGLLDDFGDELIPFADRFAQVAAAQVFKSIPEHISEDRFFAVLYPRFDALEDRRSAGQRFETAFVAATAFRSRNLDHHVADFAGGVIEAAIKLAIDDQAAADPCTHKNTDDIFWLRLQLRDMHAQHSNVSIVLDKNRQPKLLLEFLFERDIFPPFEVRREDDRAGAEIHSARRSDANTADLFHAEIGFIDRIAHATFDAIHHCLHAALRFGADLGHANAFE